MQKYVRVIFRKVWLIFFIFCFPLFANEGETLPTELVVVTRAVAPFAMQDQNGNWSGIAIELWEEIAGKLELSYDYKEASLENIFEGLQDGTFDAAVAALSITSEREEIIDFTHFFYNTGLGIAVASKPSPTWWGVVRGLLSRQFIESLATLVFILFIFGFFIWLFERRRNKGQFGGNYLQGIGSGFWWSAVTMTTVGYGDKAPITFPGKILALIWMFSGIILISTVTAAITSALTVASLDTGIQGPKDLPRVRTGTIAGTTSAAYFAERGISAQLYHTLESATESLASGEIEAVVYDKPILSYFINKNYPGKLTVLARTFEDQQYGIALPLNSSLRQPINHALLSMIESGEFNRIKQRYLGE